MQPIKFPQANIVYGKDQEQYLPLYMYREPGPAGGAVAIWELTDEDIEELKRTRRLYVMQMTFHRNLQPIMLSLSPPFKNLSTDESDHQQREGQS